MNSMLRKLTVAATALCTFTAAIPETQAAEVRLEGYGYYLRSRTERYYGGGGKKQSGRVKYLQSDYYRHTEIGVDFLTNYSPYKSGSLSFEFWAMPYYGATKGIILMTLGTSPLSADSAKKNFHADGYAVSLDAYRYPELNLWEYTRKGWKFRDALSFTKKSRL
jgi:hypothetical protein